MIVKLLVEKDAVLEFGDRSLLWAARSGHELVVKLLVEKGTELESRDKLL